MRCANCFKQTERAFCSLDCAIERWSLMLEGVELLDSIMRMVDEAAEKRASRAVAQPAPSRASKPPKPLPRADAEGQTTMTLLPTGQPPNGFEAA